MQNKFIMALEKPTPFTLSFKTNSKHKMIFDIVAKSYNQNRSEYMLSMIRKGMTLQEELDAANERLRIFNNLGLEALLEKNKGATSYLHDEQGNYKHYTIETMRDVVNVLVLTAKNHLALLQKNMVNNNKVNNN